MIFNHVIKHISEIRLYLCGVKKKDSLGLLISPS